MLEIHDAADLVRTGDLLLFRGRTLADRTIRTISNAPVNHVGVAIVIDDLPPLLLHAELSRKQLDIWTGGYHRGVQLHDLAEAVERWSHGYAQEIWMRQLAPEVGREQEDAALKAVARLDGVPYPATLGARPLVQGARRLPAAEASGAAGATGRRVLLGDRRDRPAGHGHPPQRPQGPLV